MPKPSRITISFTEDEVKELDHCAHAGYDHGSIYGLKDAVPMNEDVERAKSFMRAASKLDKAIAFFKEGQHGS